MDKADLAFLLHRNTTRRVGEQLGMQLLMEKPATTPTREEDVTKRVTRAHTHQFSTRLLMNM